MNFGRKPWRLAPLLATAGLVAETLLAEPLPPPRFRSFAGAFLASEDHNFFVESEFELPLYHAGRLTAWYHHRESTPFLDLQDQVQAAALHSREELQVDLRLTEQLRLIARGGYHAAHAADATGKASGYILGGGLGAPEPMDGERLYWEATAGAFLERVGLDADWWAEARARWRLFYFVKDEYLGSAYRASLAVAGDAETANDGARIQGLYRAGVELQLITAHGNLARAQLQWYHQDRHPFYGYDERGLLLGLDITSERDATRLVSPREERSPGWFPVIWGGYDAGVGNDRRVSVFEMNVEVVDLPLAEQLVTFKVWYETHQEHRIGDFDNVSYSVAMGLQTPVGLASPLSQGDPLVAGFDFVHRSDHALNPPAARVAAGGEPSSIGPLITSGSFNTLPRLRLQTIGWDLPYRDPAMYERETRWLNRFDWRVMAGYTLSSTRNRGDFSGQLGVNWDVATLQGYVVYLRGIGSAGEETPDWLGEIGVRRPAGKVFFRYEDYGIHRDMARGDILVVGLGVHL